MDAIMYFVIKNVFRCQSNIVNYEKNAYPSKAPDDGFEIKFTLYI